MNLEATLNGTTIDTSPIEAHIDKTTNIDFIVKNVPRFLFTKKKDFYWKVSHNSTLVDVNDYTGGEKAELKVFKSHAGTKEKPANILVEVFEGPNSRELIDKKSIYLSANPKITSQWEITQCRNLEPVPIYIDQEGLYDFDVTVKIYDQANDSNPISPNFSIKLNAGSSMVEWRAKNNTKEEKKCYYTISYIDSNGQEVILFDGKQEGMLLTVAAVTYNDHERQYPTNLTPVTVFSEEYFTQKYEPCKYSKIEVTIGEEAPVTIFDETKSVSRISDEFLQNLLSGATGNKNIKIKALELKTDECRLPLEGKEDTHQVNGDIFDTEQLDEVGIKVKKTIDTLIFYPAYPYKHINEQEDYVQFLLAYFLPKHKQEFKIGVDTCRYRKSIEYSVFPDVAWACHFQYNVPEEGYFKDITVPLIRGLDSEIDFIKPYITGEYNKFYAGNPLDRFILDLLIEYIRDLANKLAFGIHAYHSFDEQNSNATLLDYTAKYKWIAKTVITVYLIVLVIIEALIIYITRGRGLVTKAGKLEKVVRKTHSIKNKTENKMRGNDMSFIYPAINAYRSQGYEILDNSDMAFVMQESIHATPLFGLQYEKVINLGTMIAKATGISAGFDTARSIVSILGKIMKYTRWAKNAPDALNKRNSGGSLGESYSELNKGKPTVVTPTDVTTLLYVLEDKVEENLKNFAAKFGQNMEFTLTINGEYKANYICKVYNIAASNKHYFTMENKLDTFINGHIENNKVAFSRKKAIEVISSFEISSKITIKTAWVNTYIPEFLGVKAPDVTASSNVQGKAQIQGGIAFERVYTFNFTQPVYQDIVIFSGLIGDYEYKVNVDTNNGKGDDQMEEESTDTINVEKNNTAFVLMAPYMEEGRKIPIFSMESLKEHF